MTRPPGLRARLSAPLLSQPHTKRQAATGSRIASGGPRLPGLLPLRQGRGRDTDVTGWSSPQALHSPGPGLVVPRFFPKPSHPQGLPRSGRWNCPIPGSPCTLSSGSGPPSLNMGEPSFGSKAPVTFQEATRAGSSAPVSARSVAAPVRPRNQGTLPSDELTSASCSV